MSQPSGGTRAFAAQTPSLEELTQHLSPQIEELRSARILCGIPCYNSEETVANVVRAVETGLRTYFPDVPSGIVILDSGSTDRTVDVALQASTAGDQDLLLIPRGAPLPARVSTTLEGARGKGNALRPLFTIARATGAAALTTFDSDLRSITPTWIDTLVRPVLEDGYDDVTPMYVRHKYDGTITNSIAHPLTAALYGTAVRQPIGGDFGFSGRLASFWAEQQDVWTTDVARFGVDIWMTTSAIARGYRVAQARLGSKIHAPKDPGQHLGPMFRQVVGTMFRLAGTYAERWLAVDSIRQPPVYGFPHATGTDPVPVDVRGLIHRFRSVVADHDEVLRSGLAPETYEAVRNAAESSEPDALHFPLRLWVDVVYDCLVAVNAGRIDPQRLLDALIGLYFARTASFVRETLDEDQDAAEERIATYPGAYLAEKQHLLDRWGSTVTPTLA